MEELNKKKQLEVKSFCCGSRALKVNTTNNIICYKCSNCDNLTGVVDENGKRTG